MIKRSLINETVAVLNKKFAEDAESFVNARREDIERGLAGNLDQVCSAVEAARSGLTTALQANYTEDDYHIDNFISSVRTYYIEESQTPIKVTLTFCSKRKAAYKFKKKFEYDIGTDILSAMKRDFLTMGNALVCYDLALQNIASLNEYMASAVEEAGIPYGISFVMNDYSYVTSISDTGVVFGLPCNTALRLATVSAFRDYDEDNIYLAGVAESHRQNFIKALKSIETTPQLIRANVPLFVDIFGGKTRRRADKLIRGDVAHKQAKCLGTMKKGLGYLYTDTEVNGKQTKIFGLVEKTVDGEIKVVLSPFDISTKFKVDYDIVSAVKASFIENNNIIPAKNLATADYYIGEVEVNGKKIWCFFHPIRKQMESGLYLVLSHSMILLSLWKI